MGDDVRVTTTVRAKPDAVAMAAVDRARDALLDDVDAADVGEYLGAVVEGERLVTHLFACTRRGYAGWRW
jgi:flavin-binding protein dodecin